MKKIYNLTEEKVFYNRHAVKLITGMSPINPLKLLTVRGINNGRNDIMESYTIFLTE